MKQGAGDMLAPMSSADFYASLPVMGDLETAKVQRLDAGATIVIPANTWHVEWWETETVIEAETIAPTGTERAMPASPRVP